MLRVLAVLALGWMGCLPSDQPPEVISPQPPPSCGNRLCEPSLTEDNVNCPTDCPPCYAISAVPSDTGQPRDEATGREDSRFVDVGQGQAIEITLGRDMQRDDTWPKNLQLFGSVMGSAKPLPSAPCPEMLGPEYLSGAVQVQVSADGHGNWQTLSFWTQGGTTEFNLSCARQLNTTRNVRLVAGDSASFKLDAVHALYRDDLKKAACDE